MSLFDMIADRCWKDFQGGITRKVEQSHGEEGGLAPLLVAQLSNKKPKQKVHDQ